MVPQGRFPVTIGVGNVALAASPLRNLQFSSRFKVLATEEISLTNPNMVWDGTNVEQNGLVVPFKIGWNGEMPITYSGTTGVIANTVDNSIHVIAFCNNTDLDPLLYYNARIRFVG